MSSRPNHVNVKPLTHWVIHKGYTVRFTARRPDHVAGILSTPDGPVEFTYDPAGLVVHLPGRSIPINAYGWETGETRNPFGSVTFDTPPTGESRAGESRASDSWTGAPWLDKLQSGKSQSDKPSTGGSSDEPSTDDRL